LKIQLINTQDGGLYPDSAHDDEQLSGIHIGDVVTAEIKKARNPAFHRKAFAMLHDIFDNQDKFEDFDRFREWLQIAAGVVDIIIGPDGQTYYKVRSLAWDKMDDAEFSKTYQAFITAAYEKLRMEWVLEAYA